MNTWREQKESNYDPDINRNRTITISSSFLNVNKTKCTRFQWVSIFRTTHDFVGKSQILYWFVMKEGHMVLMAYTHCMGPGTGQGLGPRTGMGSTVHVAVQGKVQGIGKTYDPILDPVVKWIWNPSLLSPVPGPSPCPCAVCKVHSMI